MAAPFDYAWALLKGDPRLQMHEGGPGSALNYLTAGQPSSINPDIHHGKGVGTVHPAAAAMLARRGGAEESNPEAHGIEDIAATLPNLKLPDREMSGWHGEYYGDRKNPESQHLPKHQLANFPEASGIPYRLPEDDMKPEKPPSSSLQHFIDKNPRDTPEEAQIAQDEYLQNRRETGEGAHLSHPSDAVYDLETRGKHPIEDVLAALRARQEESGYGE